MTPTEIAKYEADFLRVIAFATASGPTVKLAMADSVLTIEPINERRFLVEGVEMDRTAMYARARMWRAAVMRREADQYIMR